MIANPAHATAPAIAPADDEATRDLSGAYLRWQQRLQARQGCEGEPLPPLPKPECEFYTITVCFMGLAIKQPAQVICREGEYVLLSWNFKRFVRLACEVEPVSRVEAFELGQDDREE